MPRPSNTQFFHWGFEHRLPQYQNPSIFRVTYVDDSENSLYEFNRVSFRIVGLEVKLTRLLMEIFNIEGPSSIPHELISLPNF
jgi:hypothetical protein